MNKYPALPFVAPFLVFLFFLAVDRWIPLGTESVYPIRVLAVSAALWVFARKVIPLRASHPIASIALGLLVFAIWVGPDFYWPAYRDHWLFQNRLLGEVKSSVAAGVRSNLTFVFFRVLGCTLIVPIMEELFWRGWLMRFLINSNFRKVPLGAYAPVSFWITAILFASEHGPYWEVGLVAGIAYNWWIVRTKNLADCILAHVVTNGCLSIYVLAQNQWQYWY